MLAHASSRPWAFLPDGYGENLCARGRSLRIPQVRHSETCFFDATTLDPQARRSIFIETTWLPAVLLSRVNKKHMALNAYLKLSGSKQGQIKGSVTQKGREGQIMVIAADHEVISRTDPASGMPTGKRQHKPFKITKAVDRSSPLLYQAMINAENITQWELLFWTTSSTGGEEQYYTVTLTNARISDVIFHMPNTNNPDLAKYPEYEEIFFTYQKIQWIWTDGGLSAQDDCGVFG